MITFTYRIYKIRNRATPKHRHPERREGPFDTLNALYLERSFAALRMTMLEINSIFDFLDTLSG